jgi:hypothetical protein
LKLTHLHCLLSQIVPLPFNDEATQQQQQQQAESAQLPVQQLIAAAQQAAGAQPLQVFPVRQLPFRAYAAMLDTRWDNDAALCICGWL